MASHATHRAQAKSLLKRGLITEKQHDRMMAKIDAMPQPPTPSSGDGADPQLAAGVAPADAAQVPVTASVPGDPNAMSDLTKAQQPRAA